MDRADRKLVKVAIKLYEKLYGSEEQRLQKKNDQIVGSLERMSSIYSGILNKVEECKYSYGEFCNIFHSPAWNKKGFRNLKRYPMDLNLSNLTYFSNQINYHANNLRRMAEEIQNSVFEIDRPKDLKYSVQDIIEELFALKASFGERFFLKEDYFVVVTDPITLEDENNNEHELGAFEIWFHFTGLSSKRSFHVKAQEPNYCGGGAEYFHPHVAPDGTICEGEAAESITVAFEEGRISDIIYMIISVLNTYNDRSPYKHLESWGKSSCCAECGYELSEDDVRYCCVCRSPESLCFECIYICDSCCDSVCSEHTNRCNECGNCMCDSCSTSCPVCGETVCEDCQTICYACGDRGCPSCMSECENCGERVCSDCQKKCSSCRAYGCQSCFKECNNCGERVCETCYEPCGVCGEEFCSDCLKKCSSCGYEVCKKCSENCELCNKIVCSDCSETYEELLVCPDCKEEKNVHSESIA
jgi:hypothetical protein